MKRTILFFIILPFLFSCHSRKGSDTDSGKEVITVSILPQRTFVEKIAGDDFEVNVLIPPGASPAAYTLLPSQLKDIARSEVWFRMGYIGFELSWKEKIEQANKNMQVVDLSRGLDLISTEPAKSGAKSDGRGVDPHLWLSPSLVKQIARRMATVLSELKPERKEAYQANLEQFEEEIDRLDGEIKNMLNDYGGRTFITFHPSLSYYAREYGLVQHSLESGGKEPTPQHLTEVVLLAREEGIDVIYIQSEFDREHARVFAEEIDGRIIEVWPLNPDWAENLLEMTRILAVNFENTPSGDR